MLGPRECLARLGTVLAGIALASCQTGDNLPGDARCPVECIVDCPPDVACPDLAECAPPPKYLCPPGFRPLARTAPPAPAR